MNAQSRSLLRVAAGELAAASVGQGVSRVHGSRMHLCAVQLLIRMSLLTSQGVYYVDRWMTGHRTQRALEGLS